MRACTPHPRPLSRKGRGEQNQLAHAVITSARPPRGPDTRLVSNKQRHQAAASSPPPNTARQADRVAHREPQHRPEHHEPHHEVHRHSKAPPARMPPGSGTLIALGVFVWPNSMNRHSRSGTPCSTPSCTSPLVVQLGVEPGLALPLLHVQRHRHVVRAVVSRNASVGSAVSANGAVRPPVRLNGTVRLLPGPVPADRVELGELGVTVVGLNSNRVP